MLVTTPDVSQNPVSVINHSYKLFKIYKRRLGNFLPTEHISQKQKTMVEGSSMKSYKIVMLGDAGVGKTCIVNRYIKGSFSDTEATLGSNYSAKTIEITPQGVMQPQKVKLQIWDTAGGE